LITNHGTLWGHVKSNFIKHKRLQILAFAVGCVFFVLMIYKYAPLGFDWQFAYRPAVQLAVHGETPYLFGRFFNPPWLLLVLSPFALLPEKFGFSCFFVASYLGFAYLAYKMGAKPLAFFFFLASQPVIACVKTGNVDWIALMGVLMPPNIGLLFVLIKPQVGIGIALYWSIQEWKKSRFKGLLKLYFPTILALILSILVFGLWPLDIFKIYNLGDARYNDSIWPVGIPVGLVLLTSALKNFELRKFIAFPPFLSPYVLMQSWSGVLLSMIASDIETIAAVLGMYIIGILKVTS
jgi:hypothetical protein